MHTNFYKATRIVIKTYSIVKYESYDDWHNEQEQLKSLEENSVDFQSRLLGYYTNRDYVWHNYQKNMKRIINKVYQIQKIMDIVN